MEEYTKQEVIRGYLEAKADEKAAKERLEKFGDILKASNRFENGKIERDGLVIQLQEKTTRVENDKFTPEMVGKKYGYGVLKVNASLLAKIDKSMVKPSIVRSLTVGGLGKSL